MPSPEPKSEIRRTLRAQRRGLSPDARERAALALCENVAATRTFRAARRIACYLPNDGEIDPTPILRRIPAMGKIGFLPVLSHLRSDRLWFAQYKEGMPLRPNHFGIPEPVVPRSKLVRAQDLDLVLLPLVAVDTHGNRLGMGGGFYDRSLEFLRHRQHWRKPRLFGVAFDFQRVVGATLPADPWDVPLSGVVTDRGVYLAAPR